MNVIKILARNLIITSIQVHTVLGWTQWTPVLIKFKQEQKLHKYSKIKCYHTVCLTVNKNNQILANGYSFWKLLSISRPVISNLTSWFSWSGSDPRHIHWKGTQLTSIIVKHTQSHRPPCVTQVKYCNFFSKVNKSDFTCSSLKAKILLLAP